ncbi:hypothetical protein D4764_14G0011890 [Takifugu flavidus]|uniref:Uncharacterized protein n=1 Tax=Takifugu flavidus TaxID=433684 RepID=A0A5C6P7N0_9TELE|nr:hypothetical protein D4764_14G0011890 [Takifugu flavidus]
MWILTGTRGHKRTTISPEARRHSRQYSCAKRVRGDNPRGKVETDSGRISAQQINTALTSTQPDEQPRSAALRTHKHYENLHLQLRGQTAELKTILRINNSSDRRTDGRTDGPDQLRLCGQFQQRKEEEEEEGEKEMEKGEEEEEEEGEKEMEKGGKRRKGRRRRRRGRRGEEGALGAV